MMFATVGMQAKRKKSSMVFFCSHPAPNTGAGTVHKEEFQLVLQSLNVEIKDTGVQFTQEQINDFLVELSSSQ